MFDPDPDGEDMPLPTKNFSVGTVASYLAGIGANHTQSFALKHQLMPFMDDMRFKEHLTPPQIDLLLKFELLRQESGRLKNPHLKEIFESAKGLFEKGIAPSKAMEEVQKLVENSAPALKSAYPDGIPVAILDNEDYKQRGMPIQDVVYLLEHNTAMAAVLNEFNTPPSRWTFPNLAQSLRQHEEEMRVATLNTVPEVDGDDRKILEQSLAKSLLEPFAEHVLSLARKHGFPVLPENISVDNKTNSLLVKSSRFAAAELENALVLLKAAASMNNLTLTSIVEPVASSASSPSDEGRYIPPFQDACRGQRHDRLTISF